MIPAAFVREALRGAPCLGEVQGDWPQQFTAVDIDTRRLVAGGLFVALKGERTDGHAHLAAARAAGAVAAIVSRFVDDPLPQIRVADAEQALQWLARAWRARWNGKLVGLTGSNGKTTTKEMLASILHRVGPSLVTQGNLNNHLGVPLTLLRLRSEHRFAVIEMGASAAGEIAALAGWARPEVAVVTIAAAAHLEGFGSIEGVAKAKGEIFTALEPTGTAVINADDTYAALWRGLAGGRKRIEFGATGAVRVTQAQETATGSSFCLRVGDDQRMMTLQARGAHNRVNAMAAAAAASALGLSLQDIVEGLEAFVPVAGRLRRIELDAGRCVYDDSYNANPGSLRAAIDVLATEVAPRLLCLGNMAELGASASTLHAEVGTYAAQQRIDALWSAGDLAGLAADSFGEAGRRFDTVADLSQALIASGSTYQSILIKGSRSARMDIAVAALVTEAAGA